jgi:hypothetical protein
MKTVTHVIDMTKLDEQMERARAIMRGEIKATPEQRVWAKQMTYAERYSATPETFKRIAETGDWVKPKRTL